MSMFCFFCWLVAFFQIFKSLFFIVVNLSSFLVSLFLLVATSLSFLLVISSLSVIFSFTNLYVHVFCFGKTFRAQFF